MQRRKALVEMKPKPVKRRFVRTIVKNLQKLRSSQMEHKLRIKCEVFWEPKATWIILVVITKFLTLKKKSNLIIFTEILNFHIVHLAHQSYEHSINPT